MASTNPSFHKTPSENLDGARKEVAHVKELLLWLVEELETETEYAAQGGSSAPRVYCSIPK